MSPAPTNYSSTPTTRRSRSSTPAPGCKALSNAASSTLLTSCPSRSKDHIHTIITVHNSMHPTEKYAWEIVLHGDIYRGCCNFLRWINGVEAADILISPWDNFIGPNIGSGHFSTISRNHDDSCDCTTKHTRAVMETCPAAKRLRGENRTRGFFGKPSKNPCTIWPEP